MAGGEGKQVLAGTAMPFTDIKKERQCNAIWAGIASYSANTNQVNACIFIYFIGISVSWTRGPHTGVSKRSLN